MMSSAHLHNALLRPAILQILRAAGFNYTRAAVLDTVTDLAARYMALLASSTARNAFNNHNDFVPTVQDVRMALLELGALRPQMSLLEENAKGTEEVHGETVPFEDMRGVDEFVNWAKAPGNKEIRRVAGFSGGPGDVGELAVLEEQEDYVTALKKKHSKTGEESRYQGTLLGKDADEQNVMILGGPVGSIQEWNMHVRSRALSAIQASPVSSGISSAPITPMDEMDDEDIMDQ